MGRVSRTIQGGFTLIEMAMVMVIASMLVGAGLMLGQSLINSMYAKELLAMARDLSASSRFFKEKFHYLPGDLPLAGGDLQGVLTSHCHFPTHLPEQAVGVGVGNGLINKSDLAGDLASESLCVRNHLSAAGLISGGAGSEGGILSLQSRYGSVDLIANSGSGLVENHSHVRLPAHILNVIEFSDLPRAIALEMDLALDDGRLTSGLAQADIDPGVDSAAVVRFFAVPL
ncbi:MAG: prepilin-type N-terminal cleavage/methylation domain-containing protein [Magnetococcales bacterium]|nr:prepilin-type N-terminal cleavage/methylation domain-containing protein [Magnetococcales bacterium]